MPRQRTSNRSHGESDPDAPGEAPELAEPDSLDQPRAGIVQSPAEHQQSGDGIDDLTYREARTALDLTLAELQSSQLDVETMARLYQRALRYLDHCEDVLKNVEQEVMQWDPAEPAAPPKPLDP